MTVNGVGNVSLKLGVFLSGAAVALMLAGGSPAHARMGADPVTVASRFFTKDVGSPDSDLASVLCALNGTGCANIGGVQPVQPVSWAARLVVRDGRPLEQNFQATTGIISWAVRSYGSAASSSDDHVCVMHKGAHRCVRVFSTTSPAPLPPSCPNIDVQRDPGGLCDGLASDTSVNPDDVDYVLQWSQVDGTENATITTCQADVDAQCLPPAGSPPQMTRTVGLNQGGGFDATYTFGKKTCC